jgi:hypothetical protein
LDTRAFPLAKERRGAERFARARAAAWLVKSFSIFIVYQLRERDGASVNADPVVVAR